MGTTPAGASARECACNKKGYGERPVIRRLVQGRNDNLTPSVKVSFTSIPEPNVSDFRGIRGRREPVERVHELHRIWNDCT